jgi:hypothetical protein
MPQISKRLEALERAADKEVLANAFSFAIAYYLGGARHESEVVDAYARALGYKNLDEFCQAFADLLREPSDSVANRRTFERTPRAQCNPLAKFGYDLRRTRPAVWPMPRTELSEPFRRNGLPPSNPGIGNRARPRRG